MKSLFYLSKSPAIMTKTYVPVFALTLLTSAFLLFLVQPLFGKMILPILGGSSHIWITALLFFQTVLLLGYAYAHFSAVFLSVRAQAVLHIFLIGLCFLFLPISIPENWMTPPDGDNPAFWLLGLMGITIGMPFFVLSASAPMFQRWFSKTPHKDADNPYFLYATSNLGSLAALLVYPLVFEPFMELSQHIKIWAVGYSVLAVLTIMSAALTWKHDDLKHENLHLADPDAPNNKTRLLWLALSFAPSSLLMGVTTYVTLDIASMPLIWVFPLALYLITFILAFSRKDYIPNKFLYPAQFILLLFVFVSFVMPIGLFYFLKTAIHFILFFISALIAHKALSASKPSAKHLTEFYLLVSLGGALGGVFNALIAPVIFTIPLEYPLVLGLITFARYYDVKKAPDITIGQWVWADIKSNYPPVLAALVCTLIIAFSPWVFLRTIMFLFALVLVTSIYDKKFAYPAVIVMFFLSYPGDSWAHILSYRHLERNFYGVIKVYDEERLHTRVIRHGTTLHGTQSLTNELKHTPITYYNYSAGVADAFGYLEKREKNKEQNVAVIGLGAGTLACYSAPHRHFDFYEIDPAVVRTAENKELFTYLSGCGSPYDIYLGDGRLKIDDRNDQSYNLIVIDAFSSDNIPVHLLTKEAFDIYKAKLKKGGIIAIHITNRHLDLKPVINAVAQSVGGRALFKTDVPEKITIERAKTTYAVTTFDDPAFSHFNSLERWAPHKQDKPFKLWTDQYSFVLGVIKR